MKLTKLHLIIILALALILCPILGVCYPVREGYKTYSNVEGLNESESENGTENEKNKKEQNMNGYNSPNFSQ